MKNSILITLIVLSLALNGWFALTRTSGAGDATAGAAAASASGSTLAGGAKPAGARGETPVAPQPIVWQTRGDSDEELRTLTTDLRAAGFPPTVVAKIIAAQLRDRAYEKMAALPFWQLNGTTREARKLQLEANRELQSLVEKIVGPAGSQVALMDPTQRRERYGDLPEEKIATLLRIDRDYQDLSLEIAMGGAMTAEEGKALQEQFRTLEKERLADIKAALGPEAYADYERQNSGAAAMVMRGLRDLKVSEEEYNALFAAQKVRNPNESSAFSISMTDPVQAAANAAFYDQVQTVLGAERAHAYLKAADSNYGQIARFLEQQPGVAPATTYKVFQLQNEARLAMQQLVPRDGDGNRQVDVEKGRQIFADLNARLDALLGAEAAKAFRAQSAGSPFRNFASRPTPSGATPPAPGTATPAVRLPGTGGG